MNIDSMQWYNIIAFTGEETLDKTLTLMEQKMVAVQKAYWNDTSPKTPQGRLSKYSVFKYTARTQSWTQSAS